MKALHVNMTIDPVTGGGTANRTMKIAKFMQRAGNENIVLSTDQGLVGSEEDLVDGVKVISLQCIIDRLYLPWFSWGQLKKLVADVDIIHLMSHWTIINIIVYLLARKLKKPYTICPAGALYIFGRSVFIKRLYNKLIGYNIVRNADVCIAITEKEIEDFVAYGVSKSQIVIIPNGIDTDTYHYDEVLAHDFRDKFGLGDAPFILYMGRLNSIKGPDLLLEAFLGIRDRFPEYHLVMAGPDEGLGAELKRVVQSHELGDQVHFLDYIGGADKVGAYCAAELLAIPSRREAMSIVALEAGACAAPVLLTDACGFDEAGEVGGKLVSPSVESIRDGLLQLLGDKDELKLRGSRLQEKVLSRFTWANAAKKYSKVLSL